MKILHIIPNLQIGGIQRFVMDIVYYQKALPNVTVAIYVCSKEKAQWKELFETLRVTIYWGDIKPFKFNIRYIMLSNKIQQKYDIIHWHTFIPGISLTALLNNKKHIFTHHSVLGEGRKKRKIDLIKWKLFAWFIKYGIDCEVYNSQYTKSFWENRVHAPKNRLIYNGARFKEPPFESCEYTEYERERLSSKFIIGTTCNLIGLKRVDILIKAFAIWCVGKKDVCLLIVGEGPERNKLEELSEDLGINNKVEFVGHKIHASFYQQLMNICVFPSTTETFGLSAIECMHKGKPTICLQDGGGICEVIGDPQNIVSDINCMVMRFNELYQQYKELESCESEKYIYRSNLFKMENKAVEYIELYKSLL